MKNTARLQPFFIMFFVASITAYNQAVEQDSASGHQKARATFLTTEQKSQAATNTLIKYFEQMIERNILGVAGLERLAESSNIINPILPEQYHTSDLVDTFKSQLDTFLEKGKDWFDLARIKTWAQAKIQELEHHERTRRRVHEETREIHVPICFVEIPAGKYEDLITHEEFEMQPGAEIQETPVTQLQWAQIMGENPSHFVGGIDSEEVLIGGKKIKMRPDAPVENVSYNQVQEFITKLNEHDKNNTNYTYALPSVQEYQALMQSVLGSNWLEQIQRIKTCGDTEKTCTVTSGDYMLMPNKQRVFGFVGSVWQWTRDVIGLGDYDEKEVRAHAVFGGSYETRRLTCAKDITTALRPIWRDASCGKQVGVRLLRYANRALCLQTTTAECCDVLRWEKDDATGDAGWYWNEQFGNVLFEDDALGWMFEHLRDYPQETQHTLNVLLEEVPAGHDPVAYLKERTALVMNDKKICDLSPFMYLTSVRELWLEMNLIQDVSPLAKLSNLERLMLERNQIKDISPLASLTKLGTLSLSHNQIEGLPDLGALVNLKHLYLSHNAIGATASLAHIPNLTWLYLDGNHIGYLVPLAALRTLEVLKLNDNVIEDVSPLASLTSLQQLYLKNNPVRAFAPLAPLKKLYLTIAREQYAYLERNEGSLLSVFADIDVDDYE